MPAKVPHLPKYRHYKPKDLAVVRIHGQDFYLGRYGSEESRQEYRRLIAELLTSPAPTPSTVRSTSPAFVPGLGIAELMVAFWDGHVTTYYVKHGRPTSEQDNIRQALRFLLSLYGQTPAADFGPRDLKVVRQAMIASGRCRNLINRDVGRIRGLFRWAVGQELVPPAIHQALQAVVGLRQGRSEAREKPPVGPVPDELVDLTLPHLSPTVATMVRVQRLTGMRPQEVVAIQGKDISRSDQAVWIYRPDRHKNEHRGRDRVVFFGPRCQELLRSYLELAPVGFLFSPRRAEEERRAGLRVRRKSPLTPSQRARRPEATPERTPGEFYVVGSYRKAIRRVSLKLALPVWSPNQLRHTAATEIRKNHGLEASQALLGHSELGTTQIYAEVDLARARRIMLETG
jgi:integrase